jgi:hypothetical protein
MLASHWFPSLDSTGSSRAKTCQDPRHRLFPVSHWFHSVFSCQDPKVDDFCVSRSFGWNYKLAGDVPITPFNLIF